MVVPTARRLIVITRPALRSSALPLTFAIIAAPPALAQVVQPGQAAQESAESARPDDEAEPKHVPTYAAPPVYETVVRTGIAENDLVGAYAQPRWTGARLFPTTRIYVLPPNTLQLEYWLDSVVPLAHPEDVRFRNLYEVEIGLGHRLQLDLYLRTEQKGWTGAEGVESEKIELRYAFADWGRIFGNPTLYVEFSRFSEAPPTVEAKLLLGGNLAARMHWGVNLVFERDLGGGSLVNQYGVTGGLAYAVIDREFSLGAELQVESSDGGKHGRGRLEELWALAGPSIQWRPVPPLHIDLVALFGGLGSRESGALDFVAGARQWLVIGWEL